MKLALIATAFLASASAAGAAKLFDVVVTPEVRVEPLALGQGQTVGLWVVDSRKRKDIRRVIFDDRPVEIQGELAAVYEKAVADGLRQQGFTVVPGIQGTTSVLSVEITQLKYLFWPGTFGNEWVILSEFRAAKNNSNYSRTYAGSYVLRYGVFKVNPSQERATDAINKAVGDGISKLLNDANLMAELAAK